MKTRRDFLKTASVLPLAGLLDGPSLLLTEGDIHAAEEPIYAGKPMSYWLATLTSQDYDRDVYDLGESWMFHHFGDLAVPGLIEAMKDDGWSSISTELAAIGSPATVRALTQALKHEDRRVRTGAAASLYSIGRYRAKFRPDVISAFCDAFPALVEVLKIDKDSHVAQAAALVLFEVATRLDPTFPLPLKISDYENAGCWAQAVRRYPTRFQADEVVPSLVARLDDEDAGVRFEVAQTLSMFDPDHPGIVPIFVEYVIVRDPCRALEFPGLKRLVPKALPALREAFGTANPAVRSSVLQALGSSGSPAVIPDLAEGLNDESWEVRCAAVSSLHFAEAAVAVPLLVQALRDDDRRVRRSARRVFKRDEPLALAALPELIGLLEKDGPIGRAFAALALKGLKEKASPALPALQANLEHADSVVRIAAAIAIAEVGPVTRSILKIVSEGTDHEEQEVRNAAIDVLGRSGRNAKIVLPRIIEGLKHDWAQYRLVWILAELGPDAAPAVPRLIRMMEDPPAGRCIPEVLGEIGPTAIPLLTKATRSRDLLIRSRAVRALGHMGEVARQFVPMFIRFLENGPAALQIAAADALGHIGPKAAAALPALKDASDNPDIAIRVRARAAVSQIEWALTAPPLA